MPSCYYEAFAENITYLYIDELWIERCLNGKEATSPAVFRRPGTIYSIGQ